MRAKNNELSAHSKTVLQLLSKQHKPMTAYDILDRLRPSGIKAPPTVYRALEALKERGLVHKIETLNAFVACHENHDHHAHDAKFAVCRACGKATEILDAALGKLIADVGKKLKFHIEHETLELSGLCNACYGKARA